MEWVKKYRPKNSSEIQGQDKVVSELKIRIESYKKGSKSILLYGPPGTGKTSSVYAIANELNLEIVEINASDVRNKEAINSLVGSAMGQMSLFSKGKIVLVDEIDGLSGRKDRGAVPALMKLAEQSVFPVVMTANDAYSDKLKEVRKKAELINFQNLNYLSVAKRLTHIISKENIKASEESIKSLARKANGDLRAAINDLQALASDGVLSKEEIEIMDDRKRTESITNALMKVFKTTQADIARKAYEDINENIDELFLWVEQNIAIEYKKPKDIARAFDNLSVADVFFGRIRKWQHYRFYVYCFDLLSAGIALSKDEKYSGFTKYQRSTKPLKIWQANMKYSKKKSIAQKVSEKTHISTKQAMQDTIPYLQKAAKSKLFLTEAIEFFELNDEEVTWLKG